MTPTQCLTLPVLHAFSGCNTVSAFAGRGKKTTWVTWKSFSEVTSGFSELLCMPSEISEGSMSLLERFVVLIYYRTSTEVNDAGNNSSNKKSRTLDNIPPTNVSSTEIAHQTHLLPGQLLESGIGHGSRDARAI